VSRILVHESQAACAAGRAILEGEGHAVVVTEDREAVLSAMTGRRPDVVVFVVEDFTIDLRVLGLVRRIAPALPLIVLSAPAEIHDRRRVQDLRPVYYGVLPVEANELVDAVHGALGRRGDSAGSS